jgi:SAM-dependent methyltransferase
MAICRVCGSDVVFGPYAGRDGERCPVCKSLRRHRDNLFALSRAGAYDLPRKAPLLMVSLDPYRLKLSRHFNVTVLIKQHDIPNTIYGDICKPPFRPASFSVVIASHVLEHVRFDNRAVESIFRLLAPCGIFVSNVPCGTGPRTREFRAPDPKQHGHWRLYGKQDYVSMLRKAGFRQVKNVRSTAFTAKKPKQ